MVNPILLLGKIWRTYAQGLEVGPATKEPSDEKASLDGAETELEVELETQGSESTLIGEGKSKGKVLSGDTEVDSINSRQLMSEGAMAPKILNSGEEFDQPTIEASNEDGPEY
ncbi:hypothetical protein U1Q18_030068 [Sarracenia purpurea var. burkii]